LDSPSTPWHALTGDETCRELEIGQAGLYKSEALERQQRFGPNRLPVTPARPWLLRFFDQFRNVLI
jgi:magnesium-transporting ATPase (P-type)